jgi:predicted DNA-binding transcriptional regulator YafY
LGLGTVLAAAQLKLLAALPPELRSRATRIRERFHLDAPGWFRDPEAPEFLDLVATAVWEQRRLLIKYTKWDRTPVERLLEPLGLVLKGAAWYVVARGRSRTNAYRVSRIVSAAVLDEEFERPSDFDLGVYWQEWARRLERTLYRGSATVRLSPRAVELWFLSGPVAERALRETASEPDERGWVRVTVPIESIEHAVHDLGRYGPELEVLEPAELRDRMRSAAVETLRLYGG